MVAQVEAGVSAPPVSGAGDKNFDGIPIETKQFIASFGQDHEMAVARILWDLYDPANESYDQIEMGFEKLFSILKGNNITTIDDLWTTLIVGKSPNEINNLAALFSEHGVGVDDLKMNGIASQAQTFSQLGVIPPFSWQIPNGSPGVGRVMELARFVRVYDEYDNLVLDSQFGAGGFPIVTVTSTNLVSWTPESADWATITATPGKKRWVVYGEPTPNGPFSTEYLSEWFEFTVSQ